MLYYWYYLQFHQNSLGFGTKWIRVKAFENLEILTEKKSTCKVVAKTGNIARPTKKNLTLGNT